VPRSHRYVARQIVKAAFQSAVEQAGLALTHLLPVELTHLSLWRGRTQCG
jgi:hypothetical protein